MEELHKPGAGDTYLLTRFPSNIILPVSQGNSLRLRMNEPRLKSIITCMEGKDHTALIAKEIGLENHGQKRGKLKETAVIYSCEGSGNV